MNSGGGGGIRQQSSAPPKPSKFAVYQNPALSAALTSNSLRPSSATFFYILSICSASAFALLSFFSRESGIVNCVIFRYVSQETACLFAKLIQAFATIVLVGTFFALVKAIYLWTTRTADVTIVSPTKGTKEHTRLTNRQLGFLGVKPKVEQTAPDSSKKPPKSRDMLVPLHQPISSSTQSSSRSSSGTRISSFTSPSKSPASPSLLYRIPAPASSSSQSPLLQSSPDMVATPWSNKRTTFHKEIATEEQLEKFLADVDQKITEGSTSKLVTPPPTTSGFGVASPGNTNASATPRTTPLRPVRMSPGSQKFTTPPKKGEGDLPPVMSMEESIEAFQHLGIYPQIEQWRDRLRQWFSSMLLKPLLHKIDTSHAKVMEAAARLGITITISQVGSETADSGSAAISSTTDRNNEWKPTFSVDQDGLLHQLRATLVQTLDSCMASPTSQPQTSVIPLLQECVDAITEHQRLHSLMKGEWAKGLLPQSGFRAEYTVQRTRELAEGTCLRNYDYLGGSVLKGNSKWNSELPTDSHLLLYLFCAFLEHPKWMLHVDSAGAAQSSKNPLFLGVLPPKERFPEKYIAVISGVPSVLHPGACILAVGKQNPPIFAVYWDKKPHFSLQGRSALWDSILLLCYKIKVGYGGLVRGLHLSSGALSILPVLDPENSNC